MTQGLRISVALCTYNGAAFLGEQLDSIAAQRRRPDELVVCDDGSTDDTPAILRRFELGAPFPVRRYANPANLGSTKNFERAIALCGGDVIALADQDDVWHPRKLEYLEAALARSPRVGAVFSDAELVDERGRSLGRRLWQASAFGAADRRRLAHGGAVDVLLKRNVVTGATLSFRSGFRPWVLPIGPGWIHDGWIALVIAALADLAAVPRPLVRYRQHAGQQVGPALGGWREELPRARATDADAPLAIAAQYQRLYDHLARLPHLRRRASVLARVAAKAEHHRVRARIRQAPTQRWPCVLGELARGRYHRYANGWRSAARDLFL